MEDGIAALISIQELRPDPSGYHDTELCAFELGCAEPAHQRDYCRTHYKRARGPAPRFGLPPITASRHPHSMHNGRMDESGSPIGDCRICGFGAPAYLKQAHRASGGSYVCRYWYSMSLRERKYGISESAYDAMLIRQGNRCAVCGQTPDDRGFAVDHDHVTGDVRDLLCYSCNTRIGFLETESDTWLSSAARYLQRHRQGGSQGDAAVAG